jgi:rSAM/selenodomain-associated transferase 1
MNRNVLIVFIKYPVPGMVKSRLALHLGNEQAAEIYREIAETVVANVTPRAPKHDYDVSLCYSPETMEQAVKEWFPQHHLFSPQEGSDLGERMSNTFFQAFAAGNTKALLTGSDCPDISRTIVNRGFMLLDTQDVVLGPAYDGGYYLIGLRRPEPELFYSMDWGTGRVLQQTLDKINAAGLTVALLPKLRDIDRIEDLRHYLISP